LWSSQWKEKRGPGDIPPKRGGRKRGRSIRGGGKAQTSEEGVVAVNEGKINEARGGTEILGKFTVPQAGAEREDRKRHNRLNGNFIKSAGAKDQLQEMKKSRSQNWRERGNLGETLR